MDSRKTTAFIIAITGGILIILIAAYLIFSSRTQRSAPSGYQEELKNVSPPSKPSSEETLDSLTAPASSQKEKVIPQKEIIDSLSMPQEKQEKGAEPKIPQEVIDSLSAPKK